MKSDVRILARYHVRPANLTHVFEKRLKLLRWTLYSALFSGVTLCMCLLLILVHLDTSALIFFVLHLILLMGALITLVYELAVSFEALTEHLDVMRNWKNKF